MDYVLKTESLTKIYGHHRALDNFSMNIPQVQSMGWSGKMEPVKRPYSG